MLPLDIHCHKILLVEEDFIIRRMDRLAGKEEDVMTHDLESIRAVVCPGKTSKDTRVLLIDSENCLKILDPYNLEEWEKSLSPPTSILDLVPFQDKDFCNLVLMVGRDGTVGLLDFSGEPLFSNSQNLEGFPADVVESHVLNCFSAGQTLQMDLLLSTKGQKWPVLRVKVCKKSGQFTLSVDSLGYLEIDQKEQLQMARVWKLNTPQPDNLPISVELGPSKICLLNSKKLISLLEGTSGKSVSIFEEGMAVMLDIPFEEPDEKIDLVFNASKDLVGISGIKGSLLLFSKTKSQVISSCKHFLNDPLAYCFPQDQSNFWIYNKEGILTKIQVTKSFDQEEKLKIQEEGPLSNISKPVQKELPVSIQSEVTQRELPMSPNSKAIQEEDISLFNREQVNNTRKRFIVDSDEEDSGSQKSDKKEINTEEKVEHSNQTPKKKEVEETGEKQVTVTAPTLNEEGWQLDIGNTQQSKLKEQPKKSSQMSQPKKPKSEEMMIEMEDFVVDNHDLDQFEKKRSEKTRRENFLEQLVKEVKTLPQHFLGRRTETQRGKAVLALNLEGSVQCFLSEESNSEVIEIIPNEIRGLKKKRVLQNVFKFVCADIGEQGYVLASSGNEHQLDDYEMSEDEELQNDLHKAQSRGEGFLYKNYRPEAKDSADRDLGHLSTRVLIKSEFYRKENQSKAKIHFQSFTGPTGFNRVLPEGELIVDVAISDRMVSVLTSESLRCFSFSGNLLYVMSLNYCPLGIFSRESYVGVVYRYGLPVQSTQNLKLNLYEVYQGTLLLSTDVGLTPGSELDYIGFDERGLVHMKDSSEKVSTLVGKHVWVPLFRSQRDSTKITEENISKKKFEDQLEDSAEEEEDQQFEFTHSRPLIVLGMRKERVFYLESLEKERLVIPEERSQTESLPTDCVWQANRSKLFRGEATYLQASLRRQKERFLKQIYPSNKVQKGVLPEERKTSRALKEMANQMLRRGQDEKALLLACEMRDKTIFSETLEMFDSLGLKKLGKRVQVIVESREVNSLYGNLGSRKADCLPYFLAEGPVRENLGSKTRRKTNKYTSLVEQNHKPFSSIMMKKESKLEQNVPSQLEEIPNKENESEPKSQKRKYPGVEDQMFAKFYNKSLPFKPTKKVQH